MIKEVKINLAVEQLFSMDGLSIAQNSYDDLAQLISKLDASSKDFNVVVHVIQDDSFKIQKKLSKQIARLKQGLTKRGLQILDLALSGMSNKIIAEKLSITIETVKSHRKSIVAKAGVKRIEQIKDLMLRIVAFEKSFCSITTTTTVSPFN